MATAPNESKFNATTRSPRFSTDRALGFAGGRTDPTTGNLQEPSFTQQAGINPPPTPPDPGIAAFNSSMFPRPAGLAQTLGTSALGAVAGEGAKAGIKAIGSRLTGGAGAGEALTGGLTAPESVAAGTADLGIGQAGAGAGAVGALTAPEAVAAGVSDIGVGAGAIGAGEAAAGAGAAASGGGILAGIGDAIAAIAALFFAVVEETLQHVGINPNGPEHQMIQQFAIQQSQQTPEGQKFMQEYVALCPQLIAIINSMPDGEEIWRQNYQQFVAQALTAIQNGDEQAAGQYLTDMIWFLVGVAEGTTAGQGITLELNSMASLADKALIQGRSDAPVPGSPTGPSGVPFSQMSGMQTGGGGMDMDQDMDTDAMMAGGGMMPMGQTPQEPGQHMSPPMQPQQPPQPMQAGAPQPQMQPGMMPQDDQQQPAIAGMFAQRRY